ncbi:MAG: acyl carrier protein [Bacteroidaceae bacterium]|nr:acyl carrier protein [Bacteroidaceae bacterium]
MDIQDFVALFSEQFDETDSSEINADTKFHELEEWGSLVGMGVIALAKTQFGKTITGKEIRSCATVKDLYNLINAK